MGYTHYWYRLQVLNIKKFAQWAVDVQTLINALPAHTTSAGGYYADEPLKIAGGLGKGKPSITVTSVGLNGAGEELSHETFYVARVFEPREYDRRPEGGMHFDFCKTARKPYDLLVTAALIRLKYHFPVEVRVSSDGDPEDWREGIQLCRRVFGRGVLPFKEGD